MDRYATIEDYAAAKARIFARCDVAVINLDDPLVVAMPRPGQRTLGFSLRSTVGAEFSVVTGRGFEVVARSSRRAADARRRT